MLRRLLWLIALCLPCATASADDYLMELVEAARAQHLADSLEWRTLLHYKPRWFYRGYESQADDPDFFNAPAGKTDPAAELEATLAAFFSTLPETDKQQNPQCRFIARYQWLKRELKFDAARLPEQTCTRFNAWRASLNPGRVTLVFPAAYLNNPASLYGHTLLRVDARDQDEHTRLLAYSISYAASTTETNGIVFAFKGIFGGYPGAFSMSPYYATVTMYNDLESRDIWEYELDFTEPEIERMLMHVWELGPVHFDYFFFDENCAYHLLSLFDSARPSLRLTDRFPLWAIPADTVRAVTSSPQLLRGVTYRPARSTILHFRQQQLPAASIALAHDVALAPSIELPPSLSKEEQARVLEVAFEYLDYERLRGRTPLGEKTPARLHELLLARSKLDVANVVAPAAPAVRPDEGHQSTRAGVAFGRQNGRDFEELRLRLVYHDLLDPEEGFNRGAEIEFVNMALRRFEDSDSVRLERLALIDIVSLSPRDALLKPWSWKVNLGAARKQLAPDVDPLMPRLAGGVGIAGEDGWKSLWYGMLEGQLDVSRHLDRGFDAGAGPGIGVLLDPLPKWRVQLEGRALRYGLGDVHSASEVALNQRVTLGRDSAVRLELSHRREFSRSVNEGSLSWSYYF